MFCEEEVRENVKKLILVARMAFRPSTNRRLGDTCAEKEKKHFAFFIFPKSNKTNKIINVCQTIAPLVLKH